MVCSLVHYISIALKLPYNKNKLYKTFKTIDPEINSILKRAWE